MEDILVASGDIDILRKIIEDLPPNRFKPVASKKGHGIVDKLQGKDLKFAIVDAQLADGSSETLRQELKTAFPNIKILLVGHTQKDTSADVAIQYPVPGPILRNAINRAYPLSTQGEDLQKWRRFNNELDIILEKFSNQSYYQILGLQNTVPHHALVTVYDQLSARYHPDRYATIAGKKWGDVIIKKANAVFKIIVEAFSILSQRQLRKRYDEVLLKGELRLSKTESLDAGPRTLDTFATNSQSRKFLRLAQSSIAKKDLPSALQNLRFAQSMETNPLIDEKIAEIEKKLKND